ncbi:MAG: LysR family transcriptional regulator [Enterocloster sp.]
MNFDNYRYFAAAAEELNFTKAARKLFMTQQALSKQIDKMEKEYNTRLFNRETPMSLTPAGECMYRHVCRILDNERQMRAGWTRSRAGKPESGGGRLLFPQQYPIPRIMGVYQASSESA